MIMWLVDSLLPANSRANCPGEFDVRLNFVRSFFFINKKFILNDDFYSLLLIYYIYKLLNIIHTECVS